MVFCLMRKPSISSGFGCMRSQQYETDIQGMLREINPTDAEGMPSRAALEAHGENGDWVVMERLACRALCLDSIRVVQMVSGFDVFRSDNPEDARNDRGMLILAMRQARQQSALANRRGREDAVNQQPTQYKLLLEIRPPGAIRDDIRRSSDSGANVPCWREQAYSRTSVRRWLRIDGSVPDARNQMRQRSSG